MSIRMRNAGRGPTRVSGQATSRRVRNRKAPFARADDRRCPVFANLRETVAKVHRRVAHARQSKARCRNAHSQTRSVRTEG